MIPQEPVPFPESVPDGLEREPALDLFQFGTPRPIFRLRALPKRWIRVITPILAEGRVAADSPEVRTSVATEAVDTSIDYETSNIMVGARFNF